MTIHLNLEERGKTKQNPHKTMRGGYLVYPGDAQNLILTWAQGCWAQAPGTGDGKQVPDEPLERPARNEQQLE